MKKYPLVTTGRFPNRIYFWLSVHKMWGSQRNQSITLAMDSIMKTTPTDTIPALVGRLRATFLTGKTRCVEYRKNQLKQLYFLVKDNEEAFVDAIGQDLGRPGMETTFAEVIGIENDLATSISQLSKWSKDECVGAGLPFMLHGTKIRKDPKGTVLVLGAWNYPITVQLGPMVGAIAAGNTVILKPSELSPHTAQLIADLWSKYMDTETTAVVNGGIPEATALLDQRFEHIFYTGNGRVGRIVAEKAARWLCPVSLELGGKSPVIVDASADLKIAAHRTLWAKAFNAGQTCVAPDYCLVDRRVQDKFAHELLQAQREFWPSRDHQERDFGRIVSDNHWKRIHSLVSSSKAELVVGGTAGADQATRFIPLTILKNVGASDSVMTDEIFGPVLPIVPFDTIRDAVDFVNERDQPLALYIFTSCNDTRDYILAYTRSGGVVRGDCLLHYAIDSLPFGGTGPSGYGSYHGKAGFDCFTHERAVVDAPSYGVLGKLVEVVMARRYPPYSKSKLDFFRFVLPKLVWFGRPPQPTRSSKSIDHPPSKVRTPAPRHGGHPLSLV